VPGVLLVHGFTSHPRLTMGVLADELRRSGFAVAQPALRGHGTSPEDLEGVRFQDWLDDAYAAYQALPEPRSVVGLSMGGLVAAWVAADLGAEALVALAPALGFKNPLARLAPLLAGVVPRFGGGSSIRDPELRRRSPNYPWFPTRAFVELLRLARHTREVLPRVRAPALVVAAEYDTVVPRRAVLEYYRRLGSERKRFRVLADSGHDLLLDRQAETAARMVRDYLARRLGEPGG